MWRYDIGGGMSTQQLKAILPTPSVDSIVFWEGCDKEALMLQRCGECGKFFYYARRLCPHCGSQDVSWEGSSGGSNWPLYRRS